MTCRSDIEARLRRTEDYLRDVLLPFWIERSPDPDHGGFLSYFDRDGRPTGQTDKTLLMQLRLLFSFSLGGIWFAGAMALLMCGVLLYQTSEIMHRFPIGSEVAASLALFGALATLFWYILQIVLSVMGDD